MWAQNDMDNHGHLSTQKMNFCTCRYRKTGGKLMWLFVSGFRMSCPFKERWRLLSVHGPFGEIGVAGGLFHGCRAPWSVVLGRLQDVSNSHLSVPGVAAVNMAERSLKWWSPRHQIGKIFQGAMIMGVGTGRPWELRCWVSWRLGSTKHEVSDVPGVLPLKPQCSTR